MLFLAREVSSRNPQWRKQQHSAWIKLNHSRQIRILRKSTRDSASSTCSNPKSKPTWSMRKHRKRSRRPPAQIFRYPKRQVAGSKPLWTTRCHAMIHSRAAHGWRSRAILDPISVSTVLSGRSGPKTMSASGIAKIFLTRTLAPAKKETWTYWTLILLNKSNSIHQDPTKKKIMSIRWQSLTFSKRNEIQSTIAQSNLNKTKKIGYSA